MLCVIAKFYGIIPNMKSTAKFVIQKHTKGGDVHWDLMLQVGEALETYRLELPPEQLCRQSTVAVKIFDHPLKFLTYQGSVNNGKGSVKIADTGTYQLLSESENRKELQLDSKILKGKFTLTHIEDDRWKFTNEL